MREIIPEKTELADNKERSELYGHCQNNDLS